MSNGDWVEVLSKDMVLHFEGKRKVLSTSCLNGGCREDLKAVFNHCDMDETLHDCPMYGDTYEEHLAYVAELAGLDTAKVSGLSTAVFMKYLVQKEASWKDYKVTVYLTGGILQNGRRVGDETTMEERDGKFALLDGKMADYQAGTINMIIHIEADLSWNAMAGAIVVATEAKAAAIQEIGLHSCYSDGLSTGSGTDGIIIISDAESKVHLTQARTDVKLGELIGKAVKDALKTSLYWNIEVTRQEESEKSKNRK